MNLTFQKYLAVFAVLGLPLSPTASGDEKHSESQVPATAEQLQFVRDKVLPLLEARCFECHKASAEPKGSLVLSSRKAMLTGGDSGPAIVPDKPEESLLMEAVRYESFEMPPRSRMPDQEVAILDQWIADGAHWPEDLDVAAVEVTAFPLEARRQSHWAWQPISNPPPPKVRDKAWSQNPVDAFILAKLQKAGLTPAPEADRYTLVRRMYFDIIGLPPSVAQIEAFVSDPDDNDAAMAKVIDELLQSEHFGERWGRHWLDLVRYADTLGHEFDYPLHNAWQYRDFVIRALNADVPYDQFVREHIAGDLLNTPRLNPLKGFNESVIGTGFWFLCEDKHAPVDVRAEEAGKIDNQIDVFSKTFLGMTVACARCHDHKFDAISTRDYYALAGFLQSSRRETAWLDQDHAIENRVKSLKRLRADAGRVAAGMIITKDSKEELQRYALAALEVIRGEPIARAGGDAEIVFEDFEQETPDGWKITGEAFGAGTTTGNFPGQGELTGQVGLRLVNSWNRNDALKGTMQSPDFTITKSGIRFLIGGGKHPQQTCVNLVVEGKAVRTATGQNQEALLPHTWNVAEFLGKTGHIEIVDRHSGGWGHVNVDQIVFTNASEVVGARRDIGVVSAERNCDTAVLSRWVQALNNKQTTSIENPLSLPATWAQASLDSSLETATEEWKVKASRNSTDTPNTETELFANLQNGVPEGWFTTGAAFSEASRSETENATALEWRMSGVQANFADGVSSAVLSKELRGTLSSPTFELTHPEILIRVSGEACRVRLVIDGYLMNEFSELLFGGARQKLDTSGETRWLRLAGDIHRYMGHRAHLEFLDEGNGWFCLSEIRFAKAQGAAPPAETAAPGNSAIAAVIGTIDREAQLVEAWVNSVIEYPTQSTAAFLNSGLVPLNNDTKEWEQAVDLWTREATGIPTPFPVIAMTDGSPEDERIFIRGNHRNLGEPAARNILTALQSNSEISLQGSGRLQLADQLLDDNNPLVARVAVNRIWHHLFGKGIVESTDNFGVLGKLPSHPELLDFLATEFRKDGWSTKRLIRSVMLSKTYRLSSERSEASELQDPTNTLLHRANIRRLQGEAVRDAILTVSGALNTQQFGPPVPVHLTAFMQGRGRPGTDGPLDGSGRRSIYIAVNRNFLSPFMQAFDVPNPVTTTGKRTTSNVPAQALIMLNNEFVNQQAGRWADILLKSETDPAKILAKAWFQLFGRPATEPQMNAILQFAAKGTDAAGDTITLESLTEICHALLNAKEFLFLN